MLSAEFTAAIVTAMFLAGKPLLGLFLSTEEAGAADALAVAYQYLMVLMAFLFALFMLQAYRSSLQGLGEMTVPTLSGFAEMLMRMGAALVLPIFIGQSGVFFCGRRSMGVCGSAQSGMVLYADWKNQAGYAAITKVLDRLRRSTAVISG